MNRVEENISKLQKLLEAGVISQEEFEAKKVKILSEPSEEELSEIGNLLDEGLISQEEFEALKEKKRNDAVAAAIAVIEPEAVKADTSETKLFSKRNRPFLILIVVLVVALTFSVVQLMSKQSKIDSLQSQQEEKESLRQMYTEQISRYKVKSEKYGQIMSTYMNIAVFCFNGGTYYHRLGCPQASDNNKGTYLYYYEDAKSKGYKECPICFEKDATEFVDEYY